jgi:hypothetical protein
VLSDGDLFTCLRNAAEDRDWPWQPSAVIRRHQTERASSGSHAEVVDVADAHGTTHSVFVKVGAESTNCGRFRGGLRGGLRYEDDAQRLARQKAPDSVPEPLGSLTLDSGFAVKFSAAVSHDAVESKAHKLARTVDWLLDFQSRVDPDGVSLLNDHTAQFHGQWAAGFSLIVGSLFERVGLRPSGPPSMNEELLLSDAVHLTDNRLVTLVHGDLYSDNVIESPRGIMVTDWELAARANAAIDLATLVMGWPASTTSPLVDHYVACTARRSGVHPAAVERSVRSARRIVLARVLTCFPPDPVDRKRTRRARRRLLEFEATLGCVR